MFVLLFPGQGAQRPGMGTPWQAHPSWVLVGELSRATGRDVAHLLLEADAEELRATRNAQVATFSVSMVALDALRRHLGAGLPTDRMAATAGHSLGEYSALTAAGALSPADAALLVSERGEAMQAAAQSGPGTMAAVLGLQIEQVERACEGRERAWVANDNTPGQVVIAGTQEGVAAAGAAAIGLGAKRVIPLQVGGAFHSPLMAPAQHRLDEALSRAAFATTVHPVVANVDAAPHTDGFAGLLLAQLCSRVRWRESLLALAGLGARTFVELGPGTELSGMVRRCLPDAVRANVAGPADLEAAASALSAS